MRFVAMIFGVVVWCAATTVAAGHDVTSHWSASAPGSNTHLVYADVVAVEPLVERHTITKPRQCSVVSHRSTSYSHSRHQHRHRDYADSHGSHGSAAATFFGGLIGGLVGNQFGGGSGRKALTIGGAIVGASIANQASRDRRDWSDPHPAQHRCSTELETREVEEIAGYLVHYRYHGQKFVKRMERDPGERVRIQVQVTPITSESAG
jgi:uncharacterized protein YcfJ